MRKIRATMPRNQWIILAEVGFLALLVVYGCYIWRSSRVQVYDTELLQQISRESDYEWDVEEVNKHTQGQGNARYLTVSGWAIETNVETDRRTNITVLLQDKTTGVFYRLPTTMSNRTDITKRFYDGHDYDHSGFTATIPYGTEIDPDSSDYGIYLLVKNSNGKRMIDTEITVNSRTE